MEKIIQNFVEDLIREHKCVINNEYFCEVDDLDQDEINSLVCQLWLHDESFQDTVKNYIHDLIQSRIGFVQSRDYYENGLTPIKDNETGETSWRYFGN